MSLNYTILCKCWFLFGILFWCSGNNLTNAEIETTADSIRQEGGSVCLDESKFPITSTNDSKGLHPKTLSTCKYTQDYNEFDKSDDEYFPGYHREAGPLLYISDEEKQWSKDCLKFSLVSEEVERHYFGFGSKKYNWMPLRRYRPYFPHIQYPFKHFGRVTEDYMSYGKEDCLVWKGFPDHVKAVPCSDRYLNMCLHDKYNDPPTQSCPDGFLTTNFQQRGKTKCFKVSDNGCNHTYYRSYYGNGIGEIPMMSCKQRPCRVKFVGFEQITMMSLWNLCRIEIDPFPKNQSFDLKYWNDHIDEVQRVNWAPTVNRSLISDSPIYTLMDADGKWHLGASYNCSICEQDLVVRVPTLELGYNSMDDRLELIVTDPEFISGDNGTMNVACFTTATDALLANVNFTLEDSYDLKYGHGDLLISKRVFNVELNDTRTGEYWCEAVAYPSFDEISSNRYVINQEDFVFAITVIHRCWPKLCSGVYKKELLKKVSRDFLDFLTPNAYFTVLDVRVMDVFDSTASDETLLFHVTLKPLDGGPDRTSDTETRIHSISHLPEQLWAVVNGPFSEEDNNFTVLSFNHTLYCVSKDDVNGTLTWSRMNEIAVVPSDCQSTTYAKCVGEFPFGAVWEKSLAIECENEREASTITHELTEILLYSQTSSEALEELDRTFSAEHQDLAPVDLFLMGKLMGRFLGQGDLRVTDQKDLALFTKIFSEAGETPVHTATISHREMNATNLLLDNYERLLQRSALDLTLLDEEGEYGVVELTSKNARSFLIDPSVAGVTGVAFYLAQNATGALDSGRTRYLLADQDEAALLEEEDLEVAAFLPTKLLAKVRDQIRGPLRLVVTIVADDNLFRSSGSKSAFSPAGRVITASIPNYDRPLPALFPIVFRPRRDHVPGETVQCGFWDFHPSDAARISEWSNRGCDFLAKSSRDEDPAYLCGCQHLTNFAFLMTGDNGNRGRSRGISEPHKHILDVITLVGCILSLIGVSIIWLTALIFREWLNREIRRVLLQLSFGIGLQVLMVLLVNQSLPFEQTSTSCITIGVLLHYSVLVVFAWMLVAGYLHYMRFVVLLGNQPSRHFFLKAYTVGWVLPALPCIVICSINPGLYIPVDATSGLVDVICYPQGAALYWGVVLPVNIIVLANACVFVAVFHSATVKLQKMQNNRSKTVNLHQVQLRLTFILFFLFGFTWIFGLLVHLEVYTYVFTYLFTVLGSLQGFALFVYFILLDPQTHSLWLNRFCCWQKGEYTPSATEES